MKKVAARTNCKKLLTRDCWAIDAAAAAGQKVLFHIEMSEIVNIFI